MLFNLFNFYQSTIFTQRLLFYLNLKILFNFKLLTVLGILGASIFDG